MTPSRDDERKAAAARLRADVSKHVTDIAEKYLIPGETQEMAFMFVPSESVYAELARGLRRPCAEGVPVARRRGVALAPDAGDPAGSADPEGRPDARGRRPDSRRSRPAGEGRQVCWATACGNCRTHFNQSNEDIRQAIISIDKIEAHGERIAQVEFERTGAGTVECHSGAGDPPRGGRVARARAGALASGPQTG